MGVRVVALGEVVELCMFCFFPLLLYMGFALALHLWRSLDGVLWTLSFWRCLRVGSIYDGCIHGLEDMSYYWLM